MTGSTKNTQVLVTGGTGFVGAHCILQLLQKGYDVLIDKKKRKVSDVYLEVGFEDLSHFSFAFKKQFGFSPTKLK